jgi:hypothetical protein
MLPKPHAASGTQNPLYGSCLPATHYHVGPGTGQGGVHPRVVLSSQAQEFMVLPSPPWGASAVYGSPW